MPAARNCGGVVLPKGAGAPDLEAAAQRAMTERVAFAAQRGWYYEEWGSLLHQMTGFFAHPVWSNNMNTPILNRLQACHHPLLVLHSTLP